MIYSHQRLNRNRFFSLAILANSRLNFGVPIDPLTPRYDLSHSVLFLSCSSTPTLSNSPHVHHGPPLLSLSFLPITSGSFSPPTPPSAYFLRVRLNTCGPAPGRINLLLSLVLSHCLLVLSARRVPRPSQRHRSPLPHPSVSMSVSPSFIADRSRSFLKP